MIKKICILYILILVYILCGCENTNDTHPDIDQYINDVSIITTEIAVPSWLKEETEYQQIDISNKGTINGLFHTNYICSNNRLYYLSQLEDNISIWAYIDISSGETHMICPDPLCMHTTETCKYINLGEKILIDEEYNDVFYAVKTIYTPNVVYPAICRIDIANDTVEEVYRGQPQTPDDSDIYMLNYINNGELYFSVYHYHKEKADNGEMKRIETGLFLALDIETGETRTLLSSEDPSTLVDIIYCDPIFSDANYLYFLDQGNHCFFAMDHKMTKRIEILDFEVGSQIRNLFYDSLTKEFFLCVANNDMFTSADAENVTGYLCRIDQYLNFEILDELPSSIIDFHLTEKYIFYMVYDPSLYGTSPRGTQTIDETGGKLYRASRTNLQEDLIVFNGENLLFLQGDWFIIDDWLYFDHYSLIEQGGLSWFRKMNQSLRVNLSQKTYRLMNLQ